MDIGKHFALDHVEEKLYVTEEYSGRIWATSLDGCQCRLVEGGDQQTQRTGTCMGAWFSLELF